MAERTTADRLGKLVRGHKSMKEAMPNILESGGAPNGLEDLAGKVAGAPVFRFDRTEEYEVTSTGSVYKGDMVAITKELAREGETLRIANGNAAMLGACNLGEVVVTLFTQDDDTFLKAARWNGTDWVLGPTVRFLEGPLDRAVMIPYQETPSTTGAWYLAVFYYESEMGMVQFWGISDLTLSLEGTDLWADAKLENLCGAWTPRKIRSTYGGKTTLSYTSIVTVAGLNGNDVIELVGVRPTWTWNESKGANERTANIAFQKTVAAGSYSGTTMEEGTKEDYTVPAADPQEYESPAWNLIARAGEGWLVFPGADGNRYLLELGYETDQTVTPNRVIDYNHLGCRRMMHETPLPCGAGVPYIRGPSVTGGTVPVFFTGLSRTSGPNQKSSVGVESWFGGLSWQTRPLWFGETGRKYNSNVGLLSASPVGAKGEMAAAVWNGEGKCRGMLVYHRGKDLVGGPVAELGDVGTAAAILKSNVGAALVYQRGDSVFLSQFQIREVVEAVTDSDVADGVAATSARNGRTVKIYPI